MTTIDHERFMRIALEEAAVAREEGNSAVGATIVRDGEVIARGRNLVATNHDVTAHAETVALRNGGQTLQATDFTDCTLYTTFEPCPMCTGAILLSGMSTLVMGALNDPKNTLWTEYSSTSMMASLGRSRQIEIVNGILVDECRAIRG